MLQLYIFYATNNMWFCYFSIILVLQCLRRRLLRVSSEVSSKVSGESLVRSPARSPTRSVFDVFFLFYFIDEPFCINETKARPFLL
jgi:hypothetical protein